jgi:hypothetical protein
MAVTLKKKANSKTSTLDHGIDQLLRAVKTQAKKNNQSLNRAILKKQGYGDRFIDRVERA